MVVSFICSFKPQAKSCKGIFQSLKPYPWVWVAQKGSVHLTHFLTYEDNPSHKSLNISGWGDRGIIIHLYSKLLKMSFSCLSIHLTFLWETSVEVRKSPKCRTHMNINRSDKHAEQICPGYKCHCVCFGFFMRTDSLSHNTFVTTE